MATPFQDQYGNPMVQHHAAPVHTLGFLPTTGAETGTLVIAAVLLILVGYTTMRAATCHWDDWDGSNDGR